jgi:signal transduction histidine kinase
MNASPTSASDEVALSRRVKELEGELEMFRRALSHDVRAPLATVIGFAELLMQEKAGSLSPQQRGYLGDIFHSGQRVLRLTDGLLCFSRLVHQPLQKEKIDAVVLITEVVRDVCRAEPGGDVAFRLSPLPEVRADRTLFRQMFAHLLSNAWKFTRRTQNAVVEVEGSRHLGELTFVVKDNGAGFDMKEATRLFSPCERLHREDHFEGTGMGLAIAQRIAERHGGHITAEGIVGKGARFTLTIPA